MTREVLAPCEISDRERTVVRASQAALRDHGTYVEHFSIIEVAMYVYWQLPHLFMVMLVVYHLVPNVNSVPFSMMVRVVYLSDRRLEVRIVLGYVVNTF